MTSPASDRAEFWDRCRRLHEASDSPGVVCYFRSEGALIRIMKVIIGQEVHYRAGIQMDHNGRGGVVHISENNDDPPRGYQETIDAALPLLRKHMVLDDLANT